MQNQVGSLKYNMYIFAHPFFQEYIYGELGRSADEKVIHQQVVTCLEQILADVSDSDSG